ncbi:MAG: PAS domain S-box protein [Deltaproteobacteria bacterium]|nr:PAS domain S-box protein [Deltaproteobacteria bacterium]
MKDGLKILIFSMLAVLAFMVVDTIIDPHASEIPFWELLITGGSRHELFMRLTVLVLFGVFGVTLSELLAKRRAIEETLAEKSTYLDSILRSSTDAIATTDKDLRITYYNPMAEILHGRTAEECVGRTVQEIHTKRNVPDDMFEAAMEQVRTKGEYCYLITREIPGGKRFIEARVSGIFNSKKELVGYANISRDITERRKAEEERECLISDLKDALAHVQTLSGLLPICSYCKKIRDDKGYWSQVETYIRRHSTAEFTHSICPECEKKAIEDFKEENARLQKP